KNFAEFKEFLRNSLANSHRKDTEELYCREFVRISRRCTSLRDYINRSGCSHSHLLQLQQQQQVTTAGSLERNDKAALYVFQYCVIFRVPLLPRLDDSHASFFFS